ncbi:L-type lectin-domain containing receptor kinase VIII.2 [Glycine soja]
MQVSDLVGIRVDLKSGDSMNTSIEYNGNDKGLHVWVSYSNVRPKDPILKVDFNVGMYVKDFMYVGFSRSTQGTIEVHNVEWFMAKEAAMLTTVTRWSYDSSMAEGKGKQENMVVSWLGFVSG